MWQSPDPILGSYLNGQPNGGVYNPGDLGLYSYGYQNPICLVDPNGRNPEDAEFGDVPEIHADVSLLPIPLEDGADTSSATRSFEENETGLLVSAIAGAGRGEADAGATATPGAGAGSVNRQSGTSAGDETGGSLTKPTAKGNAPSWSTVRRRYWRNAASREGAAEEYSPENIGRMKKGLAPKEYDPGTRTKESVQLHHRVPRSEGGTHEESNLEALVPSEHRARHNPP